MILSIYNALMTIGTPAIEIVLSNRARRGKEDPIRLPERRGEACVARPPGELFWLHASSVGESMAALTLIERLLEIAPNRTLLVTTGTVSSACLMATRLPQRAFHQFAPVDRPAWVRTFLNHWNPDLAIIMESEFWPTQILQTQARGIPLIRINARMSDDSFHRWRLMGSMAKPLFSAFDLVMATNEKQAHRFSILGAPQVAVAGNLKQAASPLPLNNSAVNTLKQEIGDRIVWLAASTHEGEEFPVIKTHQRLSEFQANCLTIIAPRHPHRGIEIESLAKKQGLTIARRAAGETITPETQIYIADTFGELALFFEIADTVFIAGSLVPVGGHNPVEPAHFDCAIVFGPMMSKNTEIALEMLAIHAAIEIKSSDDLAPTIVMLVQDSIKRKNLANNARHYVNTGDKLLTNILHRISPFLNGDSKERLG